MKTIRILYWKSKLKEVGYEHNSEFKYSAERLCSILEDCMAAELTTMHRTDGDTLIIWIGKGRLTQS